MLPKLSVANAVALTNPLNTRVEGQEMVQAGVVTAFFPLPLVVETPVKGGSMRVPSRMIST